MSRPVNYADRYADNWQNTADRTRKLTRDRCSRCWRRQAKEVHHVRYSRRSLFRNRPIAGHEIPGWDVFALCGSARQNTGCHGRSHRKDVWIRDRRNPKLLNRNKPGFARALFWRCWLLVLVQRGWWSVPIGLVVWLAVN